MRVASKLAAAASVPREPVMFGADSHRFRLGPVLPEGEVVGFEKRHGVRLPPDYRGFITTIGHGGPGRFGGAGPFYGLLPIEDWDLTLEGDLDVTMLARPFPAEPGRVYEDWLAQAAPGEDDEPYRGTLALSHQGCGDLSLLVLSGPARGRVVDTHPGKQGPRFTPDPDFLSWYERWLDAVLAGEHHFR
ncbi:SMI1/KNR4 family protein [Micromonospora sp. DT48]|uniref:SMI1/KNR4 family protein n=1 Tax=unclassified Micromonospora TaxID=2617518 RepID=UPI0012BD1B02|nr:SMI1/KNR4 family protein [Micromonospora sp. CP22]MTK03453.1 SMI1/KNR4 family protein [Micromonospora sp. CP22]